MRWFAHWLRWSYPDDHLVFLARQVLLADPLLPDLSKVSITCTQGRIRLTGRVPHPRDRARIEADIQTALRTAGLPYRQLVNQLYVP